MWFFKRNNIVVRKKNSLCKGFEVVLYLDFFRNVEEVSEVEVNWKSGIDRVEIREVVGS